MSKKTKNISTLVLIAVLLISTLPSIVSAHDSLLPSFSHTETIWYDETGNKITDEETLYTLNNLQPIIARGAVCCSNDTMHKVTTYREEHYYVPPLPAGCDIYLYRIVWCDSCDTIWSNTRVSESKHIHT